MLPRGGKHIDTARDSAMVVGNQAFPIRFYSVPTGCALWDDNGRLAIDPSRLLSKDFKL